MYLILLMVCIPFSNTKFISETVIVSEQYKLGLLNINPSRRSSIIVTKTYGNKNMEDDNMTHLDGSIYQEDPKVFILFYSFIRK